MLPNWLSYIDVVYVVVCLMFAWGGYQKGFATQLAQVFTFFFVGVLLFFAYPLCFEYFTRVFRSLEQAYLMWILLALLLLAGIGLFILVKKMLAALFKAQISDSVDAGWGLICGFLHGAMVTLIGMIILVMVDRSGKSYDTMRIKSYVGKAVCHHMVPHIQPRLTTLYENKVQDWQSEMLRREEAAGNVEM